MKVGDLVKVRGRGRGVGVIVTEPHGGIAVHLHGPQCDVLFAGTGRVVSKMCKDLEILNECR